MTTAIYWLAGLVVLAEALNKLERAETSILGPWREVLVRWLKILAWLLLAVGAAGAVASPFILNISPFLRDLREAVVIAGFAVLILRTRLKEEVDGEPPQSDDFRPTERAQR